MDVRFYTFDPLGVFNTGIGGLTTYNGPGVPAGTAQISDLGFGTSGQHLDDILSETAIATTTINGVTDTLGSPVYAEEAWTLVDQSTGQSFQLVTFRVTTGPNAGYYTLSERPLVPGQTYQTTTYDTSPNSTLGDATFNYTDYVESDGIVEGTAGNDVIDDQYTGDPDGDQIDQSFNQPAPKQFNWSDYADEQDLRAGVTQNTGGIEVSVSYSDVQTNEEFSAERSGGADAIYRAPGEPFSTNSAGFVFANGSADDTTLTFDFNATSGSGLESEVTNVRFRISDIDGMNDGTNFFRDIVTVRAYDSDGNEVPISITGGSNLTISGNTITAGMTNYAPSNAQASALIEVEGPVAQIVVIYDNGGTTQQGIYLSDMHFEALPEGSFNDTVNGGGGDDLIDAGAGDDLVFGGDGNDTLYGGAGADTLYGDAGDDTIFVGGSDAGFGGDGNDTFLIDGNSLDGGSLTITGGEGDEITGDVLDFNGQLQPGSVVLTQGEGTAGGKSGTATLLDGTTVTFSEIESIICFTQGTPIETPYGPRPVESLLPGDLVLTRDHGPQPLRWKGARTVEGTGRFAPIEFAPGSIGNKTTLCVSPQHRMLIADYRAAMYFGAEEVLAAADFMVNDDTIRRRDQPSVTYYHLLFDTHELVLSGGSWTESYQPGHYSLPGLDAAARWELFELFPSLRTDPNGYGQAARASVKRQQALVLAG